MTAAIKTIKRDVITESHGMKQLVSVLNALR